MDQPPDFDWELFAITAWGLWKNRNAFKHEGRCRPVRCIVREAGRYVEEFRQSTTTNSKPPKQPRQARPQWRPLDTDWHKTNVDGATFTEINYCGIGVIIKNERGQVMGAMSKNLPLPLGVMEAEAKAAKEGITLARDLGLGKVIVEGDALTVMSALSSLDQPPRSIQKVVEGSLRFLQSFKGWKTLYVSRCSNEAAHQLASHAKSISDCIIWVEDTLPIIENQVCMDVSSMGFCPN